MADYANIHGHRITTARVTIPSWGLWHGDVRVDDYVDEVINGTLTIGGLTMVCTSVRSANTAGARSQRVVAGAGGWRTQVPSKFYQHTRAGVSLSMILADVALEIGETIGPFTDSNVGFAYVRSAGSAAQVLRDLVGDGNWYVDAAGVTQIAPRAVGAVVTNPFTAIGYDGAAGVVTVAADDITQLLPGFTITTDVIGTRQICAVTHLLDNGKLRSECMVTP